MRAGSSVVYNGKAYTIIAEWDADYIYLSDGNGLELVAKECCISVQ